MPLIAILEETKFTTQMDLDRTIQQTRSDDKISCTYVDDTTFKEQEAYISIKDSTFIIEIRRDAKDSYLSCLCPFSLGRKNSNFQRVKLNFSSIDGCIYGPYARTFRCMTSFKENKEQEA